MFNIKSAANATKSAANAAKSAAIDNVSSKVPSFNPLQQPQTQTTPLKPPLATPLAPPITPPITPPNPVPTAPPSTNTINPTKSSDADAVIQKSMQNLNERLFNIKFDDSTADKKIEEFKKEIKEGNISISEKLQSDVPQIYFLSNALYGVLVENMLELSSDFLNIINDVLTPSDLGSDRDKLLNRIRDINTSLDSIRHTQEWKDFVKKVSKKIAILIIIFSLKLKLILFQGTDIVKDVTVEIIKSIIEVLIETGKAFPGASQVGGVLEVVGQGISTGLGVTYGLLLAGNKMGLGVPIDVLELVQSHKTKIIEQMSNLRQQVDGNIPIATPVSSPSATPVAPPTVGGSTRKKFTKKKRSKKHRKTSIKAHKAHKKKKHIKRKKKTIQKHKRVKKKKTGKRKYTKKK